MDDRLARLLKDIYEFGTANDSKVKAHSEKMLNITPDTGLFLSILIQAVRAKEVLEIGTSNGYSTIWIADALSRTGGTVTTVEASERKFEMANRNFVRSGLRGYIDSRLADAKTFLENVEDESVDLLFLDADRTQYASYWKHADRVLKRGGLLLVDNALAPEPEELASFLRLIRESGRYLMQTLQVGNGEALALKQRLSEE
jgi:predicted O-methyltransferase YrrM